MTKEKEFEGCAYLLIIGIIILMTGLGIGWSIGSDYYYPDLYGEVVAYNSHYSFSGYLNFNANNIIISRKSKNETNVTPRLKEIRTKIAVVPLKEIKSITIRSEGL